MIRYSLTGIFWLFIISFGFSQPAKLDTAFIAQSVRNSVALYTRETGGQSHLYNGSEYREYQSLNGEDPYFINEWIEGDVYYEAELYQNVPLLYDISIDKIITEQLRNHKNILLVADKVGYFVIKDHRFVMVQNKQIHHGFYEVAYDGKIKLYVRRQKNLQEKIFGGTFKREFENKTWYYIFRDGTYYQVKNRKSVLKVFSNHKSELVQFISQNKIKFRSNFEKSASRVCEYYNDINQ
ncbi:hypothetical protein BH10BAC4_BH10BAC4_14930 [soil metagenome]